MNRDATAAWVDDSNIGESYEAGASSIDAAISVTGIAP